MAAGVPPPPLNSPNGSYYWLEWYTNLTNFLNGQNIPWSNINFTNSNITDIKTRNHNDLQNISGGYNVLALKSIFHLAGAGYVDSTASAPKLPPAWSVTHLSTGTYQVSMNFSYVPPDFMATATTHTTGTRVDWIDVGTSGSTFTVHTVNTSNVATDTNFSFFVTVL